MADMMMFPDTWEEFEESYGFTDKEQIYTNGSRLIPSFRVKQWLEHLESKQRQADTPQTDCDKCIWSVCNYNKMEWDADTPQTEQTCETCEHYGVVSVECDRCDKNTHSRYEPQTDCGWGQTE